MGRCPDLFRHSSTIFGLIEFFGFGREVFERIPSDELPLGKTTINHTVSFFEPETWARHTGGFPFSVQEENPRSAMSVEAKKRFKTIVNRDRLEERLENFVETPGGARNLEIG